MSNTVSVEYLNTLLPGTIGFTPEGGLYVVMKSDIDGLTKKGTLVTGTGSVENGVKISPLNSVAVLGVIYDSNVTRYQSVRVVVAGRTEVLMVDNLTIIRGTLCVTNLSAPGRMEQVSATNPSQQQLNQSIGMCLTATPTGGIDQLGFVLLNL